MKKSELRKIIRENIKNILFETDGADPKYLMEPGFGVDHEVVVDLVLAAGAFTSKNLEHIAGVQWRDVDELVKAISQEIGGSNGKKYANRPYVKKLVNKAK